MMKRSRNGNASSYPPTQEGSSPDDYRTTAEHPFWVEGKGWTAAQLLKPGDRLVTLESSPAVVSEVYDTGEEQPVYNCRVADYHTYFVGQEEWGFALWAHNAYARTSGNNKWAQLGKEMHEAYSGLVKTLGYKAKVLLRSGKVADAVSFTNRIVRELKPNNARAIARGLRQAKRYAEELKRTYGGTWTYIVDVYESAPKLPGR